MDSNGDVWLSTTIPLKAEEHCEIGLALPKGMPKHAFLRSLILQGLRSELPAAEHIEDSILDLLEGDVSITIDEIRQMLPYWRQNHLNITLQKMTKAGKLNRVARGVYQRAE